VRGRAHADVPIDRDPQTCKRQSPWQDRALRREIRDGRIDDGSEAWKLNRKLIISPSFLDQQFPLGRRDSATKINRGERFGEQHAGPARRRRRATRIGSKPAKGEKPRSAAD